VACERARAHTGRAFAFEQVTIIGDTPLDVDCARACGAVAVAVATGFHPADDLTACQPDFFFPDFSDVSAALVRAHRPRLTCASSSCGCTSSPPSCGSGACRTRRTC
jgi:hypothetical protein